MCYSSLRWAILTNYKPSGGPKAMLLSAAFCLRAVLWHSYINPKVVFSYFYSKKYLQDLK